MKHKVTRTQSALTFIEVLVVIAVLAVLVSLILPMFAKARQRSGPPCMGLLHIIGQAYHVWEADNGGLLPSQQSVSKGGWADLLTNANQGAICWTNYAILAKDLGIWPRSLVCPADERTAAKNFTTDFNNSHVSYFVGVSASALDPQSIVGGDRNLGLGTKADPDYGLSPKSGKGNDVAIPISGPVSWSLKMHSAGNPGGSGCILLGDGSERKATTAEMNQYLTNAPPTTNWPARHVPATPSIRLIFP
ncbi:MAG: prepilin-type N-terminal cleavage/methylation domain-containing protein [Verrucomicrobiota bacterium]